MSELKLNGTVVYMSGAWGGASPVAGARVEIIQHHSFSSDTKSIFTGNTDASGKFSGKSKEWRRTRKVGRGTPLEHDEPDPTDVLLLTADITDNSGSPPTRASLPYAWLGDDVPTPPMVLRWQPPMALKGRVNGIDCYSYEDLFNAAARALQTGGGQVSLELKVFCVRKADALERVMAAVRREHAMVMAQVQALQTSMLMLERKKTSSLAGLRLQKEAALAQTLVLVSEMRRGQEENKRLVTSTLVELLEKRADRKDLKAPLSVNEAAALIVFAILVVVLSVPVAAAPVAAALPVIVMALGTLVASVLTNGLPAYIALLDAIGMKEEAQQIRLLHGLTAETLLVVAFIILLTALLCGFVITVMARQGEDVLTIIFGR